MELLRATVKSKSDWWEIQLMDLDIVADGATEAEMIHQLEFALCAEYHLAKRFNKTPFVNLLTNVDAGRQACWNDNAKAFRSLNLPDDVRCALAAVFRIEVPPQFTVDLPYAKAA